MIALYLASVEAAGKTALCAGIGRRLLEDGRKVGFLRPVRLSEANANDGYKDTLFLKDVFGLAETVETLSPIALSRRDLGQSLSVGIDNFKRRLKQAYAVISPGKDVVLLEGLRELKIDKVATEACYQISDILNAWVMVVLRYSRALTALEIVEISQRLGPKLLGVVINHVPESKIEAITKDMKTLFQKKGIKVLGVLPEDRTLLGISVGELAKSLNGEIINSPEAETEIVENIMLGAMTPDSGIDYFGRKTSKAAVIRGERADMQLAALQTSTKCLVITGNLPPLPIVLTEAETKHIPIIVVKQDTQSTVAGIEEALSQAKFNSLKKLEKFSQILDRHFDFLTLYHELGLKV